MQQDQRIGQQSSLPSISVPEPPGFASPSCSCTRTPLELSRSLGPVHLPHIPFRRPCFVPPLRPWHQLQVLRSPIYEKHSFMMQASRDIPLIITSAASSSERRVTPSWSVAQLKAKLEPVTGIPPSSQKLLLRTVDQQERVIEAEDESSVQIGQWSLVDYAEIHVSSKDCTYLGAYHVIFMEIVEHRHYCGRVQTNTILNRTVITSQISWKISGPQYAIGTPI